MGRSAVVAFEFAVDPVIPGIGYLLPGSARRASLSDGLLWVPVWPTGFGGIAGRYCQRFLIGVAAAAWRGSVWSAAQRGLAVLSVGGLALNSNVRPGYEQIRVTIKATGDFDDNQLAELASLTRYSLVRDIVSDPVPVAIDLARA